MPKACEDAYIVLIPKRLDAVAPNHYKPIILCTTMHKIIAKIMVNRMQAILPSWVSPKQVAFIRDYSISDNILSTEEFMHDLGKALTWISYGN